MSNQRLLKILDTCSYIFLLLIILTVPFLLDKNLVNFYIIPKEYGFIGLVLADVLFFAAHIALSKKIRLKTSVLDVPILFFLGATLTSAVFSGNRLDSFLGRNEYFTLSWLFLFFLVTAYWLVVNQVKTVTRFELVFNAITLVGGFSALIFILKIVFHFDLLGLMQVNVWNTTDKLNGPFGVWLIIIFLLTAGQLIRKNISISSALYNFFIAVLAFSCLYLLSFNILWWFVLVGLVLLLLLGISMLKQARVGWLSALFVLLILTVVAIVFGTPTRLQSALPIEAALSASPSWEITKATVMSGVKNFLVGSGLGTFSYDFSRFRPATFNYDSAAWSLRFGQPLSSLFALLAEGGVLSVLSFVFIILLILGQVLHDFFKAKAKDFSTPLNFGLEHADINLKVFLLFIVWVVLTLSLGAIFFSTVLWVLWWLLLGMTVAGLSFINSKMVIAKEWHIEDTPQYSLSFSFILIIVMAAAIMVGVWEVRLYLAESDYNSALQSKDYVAAETKLKSAIAKRNNSDQYHAALAQVYLMQAVVESKVVKPDLAAIGQLMAAAVNEAKISTDISPNSVMLWENLSTMYENAAAIVPEARGWVVKTLNQTKDLEPTNAVLWWRLGNANAANGDLPEAIKNYDQAIALKKDYLTAYDSLSGAYEQNKQSEKAITVYKDMLPQMTNSPESLFNFGRLLYNRNQRGDRDNAEKFWLQAIKIKPDYANALYSLGLLYETQGDNVTALQYYYKVKEVVPGNQDVNNKIKSLLSGG
ncbi:MAG: tetratricopeptide repeat protein [bacterium]|nr:tetratricopeptide repeat protein [bacterium]